MDETRLERALRQGPPFRTAHLPRPLVTDGVNAVTVAPAQWAVLVVLVTLLAVAALATVTMGGVLEQNEDAGPIPPGSVVVEQWSDGRGDDFATSHWEFSPGTDEPQLVLDRLPRNTLWPRWSPDGRWLTYFLGEPENGPRMPMNDFVLADADGSDPVSLAIPRPASEYDVGQWYDSRSWAPSGKEFAIAWTEGLCPYPRPECPRGVDVFDQRGSLVATVLTPGATGGFLWSPDGLRIGWQSGRCLPEPQVIVCRADAFHTTEVLGRQSETSLPLPELAGIQGWTLEDRLLVTIGSSPNTVESVYSMRSDGSDRRDVRWVAGDPYPTWSPDGSLLAISDHGELRVRDVETGQDVVATIPSSVWVWGWSPDGQRLALFGQEPGPLERLVVINADGTGRQDVGPGNDFAWAP